MVMAMTMMNKNNETKYETPAKLKARRYISTYFVPYIYYSEGVTQKMIFKRKLAKAMKQIEESDKRCV